MSSNQELACVYAALILQDDGLAITGDKILTILKAAHVDVEPFWPGLFAKALDGVDIKGLVSNVCSNVGGAPAAAATVETAKVADATPVKEEKKEEVKEESDEDMGFGLFD